jgi:hypothetical protein
MAGTLSTITPIAPQPVNRPYEHSLPRIDAHEPNGSAIVIGAVATHLMVARAKNCRSQHFGAFIRLHHS